MKKFLYSTLIFGFLFSTKVEAKKGIGLQVKDLFDSGEYRAAYKKLSSSKMRSNPHAANIRANALEKLGFYQTAFYERQLAASRIRKGSSVSKLAQHSLVLNRMNPLDSLQSSVRASSSPEFRAVLAKINSEKGQLAKALQVAPSPSAVASIKNHASRVQSARVLGTLAYAQGKNSLALQYLGASFEKSNGADLGSIRLLRAQVLFEAAQYREALNELKFLSRNSPSWFLGQMVGAWSAYYLKDYNLALGQLMNITNPYLAHKFNHEAFLLNAITLYEMCYFSQAEKNLELMKNKFMPVYRSLPSLASIASNSSSLYTALKKFSSAGTVKKIETQTNQARALFYDEILSDQSIAEILQGYQQIEKEEKTIASVASGALLTRYRESYAAGKREYLSRLSRMAQGKLDSMKKSLKETLEAANLVDIEIKTKLRERYKKSQTGFQKKVNYKKELFKGYEFWPFEGEFWRDEPGAYAFVATSVCEENPYQ